MVGSTNQGSKIAETYNSVSDFVQKFKQGLSNYVGGAKDAVVMKKQFKAAEKYADLLLKNKNLSDSTRNGLKAAYDEALATKDFFCSGKECQEGKANPKKGGPFGEFDYIVSLCEENKAKVAKLQDYLLKGEKEAGTVTESVFTSCSDKRVAQIYYKKGTTVVKKYPIYTINSKDYQCFWLNGGDIWRFIESKSIPTDSKKLTYANLVKLKHLNIDNIFRIVYVAGTCENGEPNIEGGMPKGGTIDIPGGKGTITYKKNEKGEWEVKFKIKDGLTKSGKVKQTAVEFEKQMEEVAKEQLTLLEKLGGTSKPVSDLGFYVKDMNTTEWLETIGKLGTDVWENATLPKDYWNEDEGTYKGSTVKMPGLFTGVGDGAIDMVADYPQLIKLGYDVTTKPEVRKGIWESVKNVTPANIKEMATGSIKEKWDKYNNSKQFIQSHEAGFDGVGVVATLVSGGLATMIEEIGEKFLKKADDILIEGLDGIDELAQKTIKEALKKGDLDKEIFEQVKDEINDIAKSKGKKLTWVEVKALFKRGNDFNTKARNTYDFNEIVLKNKKRLDSYIPGEKIISRKATDIDNITEQTWRNYCNELVTKYKVGTPVNSTKLVGEPPLSGKYYIEIPLSNQNASKLERFKTIAKEYGTDNEGINIIFLAE